MRNNERNRFIASSMNFSLDANKVRKKSIAHRAVKRVDNHEKCERNPKRSQSDGFMGLFDVRLVELLECDDTQ